MRLNRPVALKVLLEAEGKRGAPAARLLREARSVASFQHPNAVTIFDVGEYDGSPYIAMELVDGWTLTELAERDDVRWARKLSWLLDAARALGAAHAAGLVHRDVKPDNVIVRPDGFAKVVDFGIARRAPPERVSRGLEHQPIMGTPPYMSPEQLAGDAVDSRSDQFSWGVMSYELLAGVSPWGRACSFSELVSAIIAADVRPLFEHVPDLPAEVEGVIRQAMSKSQAARFLSMNDIVAALASYTDGMWAPPPKRTRKQEATAVPPSSGLRFCTHEHGATAVCSSSATVEISDAATARGRAERS